MPTYPNVPDVPGVPPLNRPPGFVPGQPGAQLSKDLDGQVTKTPNTWGLFKDGQPVVIADSVQAFEWDKEWNIPEYPQQNGAFQSYNKVERPFAVMLRFSSAGTEQARRNLLDSIETIAGDTELYDAVTPEKIYPNCNVRRNSYRRHAEQGVGRIIVDVDAIQIRNTAAAAFVNTKSPSGAATRSGGTVQPTPATPQQLDSRAQVD